MVMNNMENQKSDDHKEFFDAIGTFFAKPEKQNEHTTDEASVKQERIIAAFEKNMCPECGKDMGHLEDNRPDGFCSESCFKKYEETDPNLESLNAAEGEFRYRGSLSQSAKELGMDVAEYRKLREEHHSHDDIAKMKGKE